METILIEQTDDSPRIILDPVDKLFEEMVEEGHEVLIKWHSYQKDEDM